MNDAIGAVIDSVLANRRIRSHLPRAALGVQFPGARPPLLYDVSHNNRKGEIQFVARLRRRLFAHREGATCFANHDLT